MHTNLSECRAAYLSIQWFLTYHQTSIHLTRDEVFAAQIINIIFCKVYDERFTKPDDTVQFRAGLGEDDEEIKERIDLLFDNVKKQYSDVIDTTDQIDIDAKSLAYIAGELQLYSLPSFSFHVQVAPKKDRMI